MATFEFGQNGVVDAMGVEHFAWPERIVRYPTSTLIGVIIHTWCPNVRVRTRAVQLARCEELQIAVIEQCKWYIYLFQILLDLYLESWGALSNRADAINSWHRI